MAGRLPRELRLAGITDLLGANQFLREKYIGEFHRKFTVSAAEKDGISKVFRSELDLHGTNRASGGERQYHSHWGSIVATGEVIVSEHAGRMHGAIHEHLNATIWIRYGPHVVGRFDHEGRPAVNHRLREPTFQAHLAWESNLAFRLIPRWNQISISGSFLHWKMLPAQATGLPANRISSM